MKFITLDRRYHGYPKWKYALQFGAKGYHKTERLKYATGFEKLYGPFRKSNPSLTMFDRNYYTWNSDWNHDFKRNRIYFNNESDLTAMVLLVV